eukprot:gnl/TRDRNA2_/TRDRNA2_177824_c0_seq8.p1 gnl/TRDRNA2_/TRDRNA2_177824_c0~~gnl/TRDRNA2_/TRDRNA2_177824_c0_seq8.p1  ORF type:complete len:210 (+),score=32.50 gnl/TRDRNA2_/TRDRNA2_177824_c0_seq8:78-632(+)
MAASLRIIVAVAALLAAAESTSMHMAKLCRSQTCNDPAFPVIDYEEAEGKCVCKAHPCWDDKGMKHECKDPNFPHLTFSHDVNDDLKCACSKIPHYSSPFISKEKCKGHSCNDEYPILDWDESQNECLCRKNPCEDMKGLRHECNDTAFPILRYREDEDEQTRELKTVCECVAPMHHPSDYNEL